MERTTSLNFAASLELTKEGIVEVSQKKTLDKLMIKKS